MDYAKAIKVALTMKGLTQADLAARLGIKQPTLNAYINKGAASTGRLTEIANALEMKVSELVALGE